MSSNSNKQSKQPEELLHGLLVFTDELTCDNLIFVFVGDCLAKEEKEKKAKEEAKRRASIALIFPREKLWQIDFRFVKPLDVCKRVCVCVCVCVCFVACVAQINH